MNSIFIRKKKSRKISGLSLIEMMFALIISMAAIAASVSSIQASGDDDLSRSAAEHIKSVGLSTAAYISEQKSSLTRLSGSTSISVDTLKSFGFLPASFVDKNSWGSDYTIVIKTSMTPSDIEALITTKPAVAGSIPRIDMAAKAADIVGFMGGYSTSGNEMKGRSKDGTVWTRTSSAYPSITDSGQLGFLVDASWLDEESKKFLRRDGLNNMTGNMMLNNNSVVAVKDINGYGSLNVRDQILSDTTAVNGLIVSPSTTIDKMVSSANSRIIGSLESSSTYISNVREYKKSFNWLPIIIGIIGIIVGLPIPIPI